MRGALDRASDLRFTGCGFESWLDTIAEWPWASYLHLCVSVTTPCKLVLTNGGDLFGWKGNRGPGDK